MEPLKYERVVGLCPIRPNSDPDAIAEEWRQINEADARDGTNEFMDAMLDEIAADPDHE